MGQKSYCLGNAKGSGKKNQKRKIFSDLIASFRPDLAHINYFF